MDPRTVLWAALLVLWPAALPAAEWPVLSGPYLGQEPPGEEPVVFAPGLVSTAFGDRDLIISPDGREIIFGLLDARAVTLRVTRLVDGCWSEPTIPPFAADPQYACLEPTYSPDGERLFFLTNRPMPGEEDKPGWGNQNIFMVDRCSGRWAEAVPAPGPLCTLEDEYYPSVAADGTVYFTRQPGGGNATIWRSRPDGQGFMEPEPLPDEVNCGTDNYNAFIAPDQSYLIVCVVGGPANLGRAALRYQRLPMIPIHRIGGMLQGASCRRSWPVKNLNS